MNTPGTLASLVTLSAALLPALMQANPEIAVDLPGGATMEFVWIEPGTFTMGTTEEQEQMLLSKGAWFDQFEIEHPARQVTISKGFWLGKYELT